MLTLERINLLVTVANGMVKSHMAYAEVYPKILDNGQYPRDFERPKRVEEFFMMEGRPCPKFHRPSVHLFHARPSVANVLH